MPRSKTLLAPKAKTKTVAAVAVAAPTPKKASKKAAPAPKVVQRAEADSESDEDSEDGAGGASADLAMGSSDGEDEEDSDEDEDGVDEEGMARLMSALGDDALDEFEQAQLEAVTGDEGEEDSEAGSGEDGEEDEEAGSDEEEDEEEEGVALDGDDVSIASDVVDLVPKQKIEINNTAALDRIRESIALPSSLPWTETLVTTYAGTHTVDVSDDLNRELSFYKQALSGAQSARALATQHALPFTRPADFFAEMIKSDAHMQRIRTRLLDEQAGIKKSEEARRMREGKKFGKQVQVEKGKERERAKKDMEERIKGLKRKRKNALDPAGDGEDFDVAVEDALADRPAKRTKSGPGDKKSMPRHARDQKFGFGGRGGRRSKQNDRDSTEMFGGGGGGGGRGGRGGARGGASRGRGGARGGASQRPGKGRRHAAKRG